MVYQQSISIGSLEKADFTLCEYVIQFEELYYQRKINCLQFVRQSLHTVGNGVQSGLEYVWNMSGLG